MGSLGLGSSDWFLVDPPGLTLLSVDVFLKPKSGWPHRRPFRQQMPFGCISLARSYQDPQRNSFWERFYVTKNLQKAFLWGSRYICHSVESWIWSGIPRWWDSSSTTSTKKPSRKTHHQGGGGGGWSPGPEDFQGTKGQGAGSKTWELSYLIHPESFSWVWGVFLGFEVCFGLVWGGHNRIYFRWYSVFGHDLSTLGEFHDGSSALSRKSTTVRQNLKGSSI